jgi:hypothetical protein
MVLKNVVPWLRQHLSESHAYIVVMLGVIVGTTIVFNLVMWVVYVQKIPFLEQYRCNPKVTHFSYRNLGRGNKTLKSGEQHY